MELNKIRNFCIIAHIDHGKSTLADRLLEITWTIDKRDMKHGQMLDTMEIEQERWITIKLQPVRMNYKGYQLNMIDTPWHVDFQYEVSRSLASVEWALLIVDATQWIEAQTLSNVYLAIENDLDIIPVINKIDLPAADVERVSEEIINLLWCDISEIIPISAKSWENVEAVLDAVISKVKEPKIIPLSQPFYPQGASRPQGEKGVAQLVEDQELKALVFDSQYDSYRWVVSYVKVFSWEIKKWDKLTFLNTWSKIEALDVGYFSPKYTSDKKIDNWTIWYVVTGLKSIRDAQVWDTIWKPEQVEWPKMKAEDAVSISGFAKVVPFIYAWVYPMVTDEYPEFQDAMEKLMLNDSSLTKESEVSPALWHGYRCWFLWLLHLDIVKERLFREFNMDVIITSPQVTYRIKVNWDKRNFYSRFHTELLKSPLGGSEFTYVYISNPEDLPDRELYINIEEPIAKCELITPLAYVWALMQLSQDRRWIFKNQSFIDSDRVMITYELPMNELIGDFYDELKSLSSWYASMNYEFIKYREDDLIKLDILIAWEIVEALSLICHRSGAAYLWWKMVRKLKEVVPQALFTIALQAAIWWKIIARETLSALRKDVTAKLYGWDITRKRKLLDKQKEWKKKMKKFWKVELPSEAFVNLLKK